MLMAMSRSCAGWVVSILAARSVSHRPFAGCARASGGLSLTPVSVASSCAATLYALAGDRCLIFFVPRDEYPQVPLGLWGLRPHVQGGR